MAKLRKSYSNYIIRKKRQLTSKGSVYERDWMTVSELDGFAPGTVPVYTSGNFKMTINADRNSKKKYSFSNWVLNDSGDTTWDLTMIKDENIKVKSELVKPNYSSILDFACYGSAVQLIYGSINDIYEKFPAELYGTNKELTYFIGDEKTATTGYTYVENPFGIDVNSSYVKPEKIVNPLRYMWLSWDKYEVILDSDSGSTYEIREWLPGTGYNGYCINGDLVFDGAKIVVEKCEGGETPEKPEHKTGGLTGTTVEIPLGNDSDNYLPKLQPITHDTHEYNYAQGDSGWLGLEKIPEPEPETCFTIKFRGIYINGKIYLLSDQSGWHLRLKKKYVDESFEKMDDFEKVLLNRDTKPIYKAKLQTPRETENGVVISEKSYIWPLLNGGWNLDMETDAYESYLDALLYLATFYDESRADNIWRSYTHESIKNFDWTTPKDTYVPEMDGHLIDTERMEAILRVCGRQFDDLKRYIENIKFTVNVSYDSKNNMPDIALAKFLEMSGWEVKNVAPVDDNLLEAIDEYPGMTVKNTPEEANNEFLKRMILNSRNILSKKGTRAGIEAMYSMFGIFDVRYGYKDNSGNTIGFEMDEYNVLANNYIFDDPDESASTTYSKIVEMNQQKNNYDASVANDNELNDFKGLMCDHKIDIDGIHYLVPWFDADEVYDANPYYQMMGGWGKRQRKRISVPELASGVTELFSVETGNTFTIYDETIKNVKVADNFRTLNTTPIEVFHDGDVYYVVNMEEAFTTYGCEESTGNTNYVIYFRRDSGEELPSQFVPYNDEYAWYIVPESDFNVPESEMTWYAKKILYMESIHDNSIGNNPHNGSQYDGGKEFFEFYKKIFKGALDNDMFSLYKVRINQENSRRHYENRFRAQKFPDLTDETVGLENIGFDLTSLQKDNEKIWYFLSYDNGIYEGAYENGDSVVNVLHKREFGEKDYKLVTNKDFPLYVESSTTWDSPIWNTGSTITTESAKLDIPSAITSYYDEEYQPDETSSYSVINTKNLKITYHLPWELEDYVTDVVEFYVKQLIPSTVIVEFVWDYTDGSRPASKVPYGAIRLSPTYQSIRAGVDSAEIDITSIGAENIGIEEENTVER